MRNSDTGPSFQRTKWKLSRAVCRHSDRGLERGRCSQDSEIMAQWDQGKRARRFMAAGKENEHLQRAMSHYLRLPTMMAGILPTMGENQTTRGENLGSHRMSSLSLRQCRLNLC